MTTWNITQRNLTEKQVLTGVENLNDENWKEVKNLLDFGLSYNLKELDKKAIKIVNILRREAITGDSVIVKCNPYLMVAIEAELIKWDIRTIYSFEDSEEDLFLICRFYRRIKLNCM